MGEGTFAGTRGNDGNAPQTAIRPKSLSLTQEGRLLAGRQSSCRSCVV
jgi:hypothetical protein